MSELQQDRSNRDADSQETSAWVPASKELSRRVRGLTSFAGVGLAIAGSCAVFITSNELGSAALLVIGALFMIIAVLGHVPRLRWGQPEIDPTGFAYAAGVAQGANEVTGVAQEIVARTPGGYEAADELDAFRERLTSRELSRAVLGSERAGLTEMAESLGITQERARQVEVRVGDAGLEGLPPEAALILMRFAEFNDRVDHFAVARGLLDIGYKPSTPQSRREGSNAAYIRWLFDGSQRTVRLYQNSAGLVSDSKPQTEFARRLPAATPEEATHSRVRFYYDQTDIAAVLQVAEAFKGFADRA